MTIQVIPGRMFVETRSGDYVSISGTVSVQSGAYVNVGSGVGVVTSISGQAVFVSGVVDLKSGAYVNVGSGVGVTTSISGQAVFISGTVALTSGGYVNVGSGVGVVINSQSGLLVQINASSPAYIQPSSGFFVAMSGVGVITSTSISGQAVFISGTVSLTSGGYVNIGSGVGVQINPAYISGVYVNNTASSPMYVASGVYVLGNLTASISGQAVFVSGTVALLSGGYVNIGSGIGVLINSQSGQFVNNTASSPMFVASGVYVLGNLTASISGQAVFVSGTVSLTSGNWVNIGSGVGVIASISGAIVTVSGQFVAVSGIVDLKSGAFVNIGSGVGVVTSISGQAVFVSGTVALVSGGYVNVGSGVGVVTSVSGNSVIVGPPTVIRARQVMFVNNNSGGQTLSSGGIVSLSLRSLDGDIYVGGSTGIEFPYSGYGMYMSQGDTIGLDANNFNLVSVFAAISGNRVSYIGEQ